LSEGLAVVALEVGAAPLHLEEDNGFPDEIGEAHSGDRVDEWAE
jgi:hypothetical protein